MSNRYLKLLRCGLFAVTAIALPLAGCSTANIGSFGPNKLEVASLAANQTNTVDGALVEARNHFRSNNFGYSAAYYKKAVELSPKTAEGYVGLGASYDHLGRFDLSDRVYAALFKLSGGSAQYYNNLGYSHMLRGNLKGALANFSKAYKLDPDSTVVANNLQLLSDAANAARA